MIVSHRADSVNICAVVCTYVNMTWRKYLQIPIWRLESFFKAVIWQKSQTGSFKTSRHDSNITFHKYFPSRPILWHTTAASIKTNAILFKTFDIPAQPLSLARTN